MKAPESGGFHSICKDDTLFTIQTKVSLIVFFFDSFHFAKSVFREILENHVSNGNSACFDESSLSEEEMLFGETNSFVLTTCMDFDSMRLDDMRNKATWMFVFLERIQSENFIVVRDFCLFVETS